MSSIKKVEKPIIAAIQMCSSNDVTENLSMAAKLIQQAAEHHANLVVLPEMFAIIGSSFHDKLLEKEPFGHGKLQTFLSEQAKLHHIWIVGGTIPLETTQENKVRAACLVYDDQGECVARYDKIHLFDVTLTDSDTYQESEVTEAGDDIVVVKTPFGQLGLAVCYDLRFPELFRCLSNKGAEIILLPSAFTMTTGTAHWEILTRSRAIENFCYLVGACQGGTHANGKKTFGHSLIIEPWGSIVAKIDGDKSGIIYATIDLQKVHSARKSIPTHQHQVIFTLK